jgi:hypothetical protein
MTTYCHGKTRFETTMGSDVTRDGMYLELKRVEEQKSQELVAEALWHDDTGSFTIDVFAHRLPFSVLEHFVAEARRRLPPVASPTELNRFELADGVQAQVSSNNSLERTREG